MTDLVEFAKNASTEQTWKSQCTKQIAKFSRNSIFQFSRHFQPFLTVSGRSRDHHSIPMDVVSMWTANPGRGRAVVEAEVSNLITTLKR